MNPALASVLPSSLRQLFAFGSGVGIEIAGPPGAESLRVALVRVRAGSAHLIDRLEIEDETHNAAGVWGTEYTKLLRKHGMSHVAAAVLLPRRDVIIRQLALPGVSDKDLPAAIAFQLDGLHPYAEEEAVSGWARLPGKSPAGSSGGGSSVLVAITKRSVLERYTTLFAEAGVKVGAFTCSASAIYSARRLLLGSLTPPPVLAFARTDTGVEVYGESPARPVFSSTFDLPWDRAAALAASELRLDDGTPAQDLNELLHTPAALPYAAAISSACPSFALPLNLLPEDMRESSLRAAWIPAAVLAAAAMLLVIALVVLPNYERSRYLATLDAEIAKTQPMANLSRTLDRRIDAARRNTLLLDEIRSRSKADMDVLGELTRILPAPTWLNTLEVTRTQVTMAGETPQAAPLLGTLDKSAWFEASEFTAPPIRVKEGEAFRIRTNRESGK